MLTNVRYVLSRCLFPHFVLLFSLTLHLKFQDATEEHKVTAMPTLVVFKNGVEVGRIVGAQEESLKELIQKNL